MNRLANSLLICILAALPLYAAIYMRIKGKPRDVLVTAGATEIVRHEALVNGQKAMLTVLAFDESLESAVEHIRSVSPDFPPLKAGKALELSGAWISSPGTENQNDIFFLPGLNNAGHCSAWLIEKDLTQSSLEPMPGNNPLPDTRLTSWIYDKSQRTLMSVHDSDGDSETAFANALSALGKDGWTTLSKGDTTALLVKNDFPASITVYNTGNITRTAIIRHL